MARDRTAALEESERLQAERKAKNEAEAKERAERDAKHREVKERAEQEKRERLRREADEFLWVDGKAIKKMQQALLTLANHEADSRFKSWVKEIAGIDPAGKGAFMFEGDFVPDGTIEVERRDTLYLVACTSGSNKYQTTWYEVIRLYKSTGTLVHTGIEVDNSDPGWNLKIRDAVQALLDVTKPADNPYAPFSDEAALRTWLDDHMDALNEIGWHRAAIK